jgi:predicted secreted hydrolase
LLLQGAQGLSRKGPEPSQSSWYYSQPHLSVEGSLTLSGRQVPILGRAWFDHEWSESVMHPQAVGWDWIGINFDNGSALTAFRVRDKTGRAMWDGGSFRTADQALRGEVSPFQHEEVAFRPLRQWKSPTSGATYPVEWLVRTPQDVYTVRALVDDQELDSSSSTGTIYWEGISELLDNRGQRVGRGYLEMTGYVKPLRL